MHHATEAGNGALERPPHGNGQAGATEEGRSRDQRPPRMHLAGGGRWDGLPQAGQAGLGAVLRARHDPLPTTGDGVRVAPVLAGGIVQVVLLLPRQARPRAPGRYLITCSPLQSVNLSSPFSIVAQAPLIDSSLKVEAKVSPGATV